ncbi:DUF2970 domain-containing protein [Zobellella sp. DQSA1]|uniref:DUF2970 domain-containing protein n=1 Tax=Zobellella sp. DQSA1 TaxID=3342386 RepID=UPI0035C048A1
MSWKHRLQAVVAALFGVQSEKNRQQQFQGSPWPYIGAGALAILGFVLLLVLVVRLVLA